MKTFLKILLALTVSYFALFYSVAYVGSKITYSTTDSMYPTIISYEPIFTNPFEKIKVGDIVSFKCKREDNCGLLFESKTIPTAHRLTKIDEKGCMTIIGDNTKYDWSKVPCYMPEDIEIEGVVHKLF